MDPYGQECHPFYWYRTAGHRFKFIQSLQVITDKEAIIFNIENKINLIEEPQLATLLNLKATWWLFFSNFLEQVYDNYRPRSRGDNTFGSIRLSVCPSSPVWYNAFGHVHPSVHLSVCTLLFVSNQGAFTIKDLHAAVEGF